MKPGAEAIVLGAEGVFLNPGLEEPAARAEDGGGGAQTERSGPLALRLCCAGGGLRFAVLRHSPQGVQ